MSLLNEVLEHQNGLLAVEESLRTRAIKEYHKDLREGNIFHFSKNNMDFDYDVVDPALLHAPKNLKNTVGFGFCYKTPDEKRIVLFKDYLDDRFLSIGLAHLFSHLKGGKEKEAFSLEMQIAKVENLAAEWIAYNENEYPWRILYLQFYHLKN